MDGRSRSRCGVRRVACHASAHGYIDGTIKSRAATTQNHDRGGVQYEPQSLEAPKGFRALGPADGRLASAGGLFGGTLDAQSPSRWYHWPVNAGALRLTWTFTAAHRTSQFRYFMTKPGWDQTSPPTRAELDLISTVPHDGGPAWTNPSHTIQIPRDRRGYQLIYAIWDIADTSNAFYNVIDVDVGGGSTPAPAADTQAPTVPSSVRATAVGATGATVAWSRSSDDVGVSAYEVMRDGRRVATATSTAYADSGLTPDATYRYTVSARDAAGNRSAASAPRSVRTAPTPPTGDGGSSDPSCGGGGTGGGGGDTGTGGSASALTWSATGTYLRGDLVAYQGRRYQCRQSYRGWGDTSWITALSLWQPVG